MSKLKNSAAKSTPRSTHWRHRPRLRRPSPRRRARQRGLHVTGFDVDATRSARSTKAAPTSVTSSPRTSPSPRRRPLRRDRRLHEARRRGRDQHLRPDAAPQDPRSRRFLHRVAVERDPQALHDGQLIILGSTTYPGTTHEFVIPLLEDAGLEIGKDFCLAFAPERIDPGNEKFKVRNVPKVVGGETAALHRARLRRSSTRSSTDRPGELDASRRDGEAAREHLPRHQHRPRQRDRADVREARPRRLGSHRRRGDQALRLHEVHARARARRPLHPGRPAYLSWKMKSLNFPARFIELATEVNSGMPDHVVDRIAEMLNEDRLAVNGARILILGVAYKASVDDMRESPALDVIRGLARSGRRDPLSRSLCRRM